MVSGLVEVAIAGTMSLRRVANCKDFGVIGDRLREMWLNVRVVVRARVRVQLFFRGYEPGFAEEGDEAFPVFAGNVRILK